ncbi:MAG: rhomboid family intramembrane serine protease [Bacteroidales bacterium]|jgi:membrane associated rhomboid family serine protease|nr:rhomboid family intramembrane serine protease [Bacteroidales bacterium]
MSVNIILILVTVIVSVIAWWRKDLMEKMIFHAPSIVNQRQWYRLFSYGFLHANWGHLLINMFVLWTFGAAVEDGYVYWFGGKGHFLYVFLYLSAIVISTLYDLKKQRNNYNYYAVGASGAVSAVLFAFIFFYPTEKIYFFLIPIGIPAFIFGIFYLLYSSYMSNKNMDNVGHNAHFWGGVYGFLFIILFKWDLVRIFFLKISAQIMHIF